jgi:hypothetical protein
MDLDFHVGFMRDDGRCSVLIFGVMVNWLVSMVNGQRRFDYFRVFFEWYIMDRFIN